LIDAEEDRTLRAVLVGMLRERDQKPPALARNWSRSRDIPTAMSACRIRASCLRM
jgi:hypothetical protein